MLFLQTNCQTCTMVSKFAHVACWVCSVHVTKEKEQFGNVATWLHRTESCLVPKHYQQEVPTTQLTHGNDTLKLISHQQNNAVTFTSFQPYCTNTPERLQCSTPCKLNHHLISPQDRMAVHNKDQCSNLWTPMFFYVWILIKSTNML